MRHLHSRGVRVQNIHDYKRTEKALQNSKRLYNNTIMDIKTKKESEHDIREAIKGILYVWECGQITRETATEYINIVLTYKKERR